MRCREILEPELLAWLLDFYRRQLGSHPAYIAELGYLWGDIAEIQYQSLHDGVHFYAAVMLLAQYQALCKVKKPLVRTVKEKILIPLSEKVADWSQLIQTTRSDKREMATLPYLQMQMTETMKFVDAFLNEPEGGVDVAIGAGCDQ